MLFRLTTRERYALGIIALLLALPLSIMDAFAIKRQLDHIGETAARRSGQIDRR